MKALIIGAMTAALAFSAIGDDKTTTTETTTVTTASGTLSTYEPGTSFIVKETAGPVTYSYGPDVVYSTRGGVVLTPEQVQTRVRVGVPVRVDYVPQGETRVIKKVIIDKDDD